MVINNKTTVKNLQEEIILLSAEHLEEVDRISSMYEREREIIVENYQRELSNITHEYQRVLQSESWRITAPIRKGMHFFRGLLNKIILPRMVYKGFVSIKKIGIKPTFIKTKHYVKHRLGKEKTYVLPPEYISDNNLIEDIKFSIIIPLYNTPVLLLLQLLDSIITQTYDNWEVCLADGSEHNSDVEKLCKKYCKIDKRILYKHLEKNLGISGNSNEALKMATGSYVVFCDHDDLLAANALHENAVAIKAVGADVLYSDEDHVDGSGMKHYLPLFKPDWSRDLLYSQMYICHLLVVKKDLLDEVGWFNSEFDGSQDYDLMLRLSEFTEKIYHIPKLLYSWREIPSSTSVNADSKSYAQDAGLNALNSHLQRMYNNKSFAYQGKIPFVWDVRFNTMENSPLVSIIIPMRDKVDLTSKCVQSIIEKSSYDNWEILILDNGSESIQTHRWFDDIVGSEPRIKIKEAPFDFNWSKLNNFGMEHANGDVFIFLNNDTIVITPDWIERLCENALRDDIGAVGPLLLYEDHTIQHAGVVVGMGGWADHVFKGMPPVHFGSPYISQMVSRNVLAVTGACFCISKKTVEKIGKFDEDFTICGSDVELCLRAYDEGLSNIFNANVQLFHLESKSRDSFIPNKDFELSYIAYKPYRDNIDPYFNPNLDIDLVSPTVALQKNNKYKPYINYIKKNNLNLWEYNVESSENTDSFDDYLIAEVKPITARCDDKLGKRKRLNLLIPSINIIHVFGGIATAVSFFETLYCMTESDVRLIITDAKVDKDNSLLMEGFKHVSCDQSSYYPRQIVDFTDRKDKTIPVGENDIFVATGWWTAYIISPVLQWQSNSFQAPIQPLIYIIQDYEPGFYPWSSRYVMADSTYKNGDKTIAVFNSQILYSFFKEKGYTFFQEYYFDPKLNAKLKENLLSSKNQVRKKQVLIYGRPSVQRNAFELVIASIRLWAKQQTNIEEWEILSVGEKHPDITIFQSISIKSMGKLSINEYASVMKETYMAISIMVSPHPSYPPLEMSTFGVRTITNHFDNKDLSTFNDNIISIDTLNEQNIAETLVKLADEFPSEIKMDLTADYVIKSNENEQFADICKEILKAIE